jgi:RimJ/RimL family protein N-acetyltransferase
MKSGLDFAKDKFNTKQFRLTVATFNIRAIRIYEKIGFQTSQIVSYRITKNAFQVMTFTL